MKAETVRLEWQNELHLLAVSRKIYSLNQQDDSNVRWRDIRPPQDLGLLFQEAEIEESTQGSG